MLKITRLSECTFNEALTAWNRGFQGYFADMTFTMDRLIGRFGLDGLSAEMSLVAWDEGIPSGFILNGHRVVGGKRIAWNGGTGVDPLYRRTGVGRRLMNACMELYQEYEIEQSYLEAIAANTPAIQLYEQFGYRIVDHVALLSHSGKLDDGAFAALEGEKTRFTIKKGFPHEVAQLPFYNAFAPWQCQWPSVVNGQSVILEDEQGKPAAYALHRPVTNERGEVTAIALHQCEVDVDVATPDIVIGTLLREVYSPFQLDCRRFTVNVSLRNQVLIDALRAEGFSIMTEQVVMKRDIKE